MGWTFCPRARSMSVLDFMRAEFTQTHLPQQKTGFAILHDEATREGYFAVIERTDTDGSTKRFCLVCLLDITPSEIGYKDMTESMGPNILAPLAFFKTLETLIPEPDGRYAEEWRARCRAHHKLPSLKAGGVSRS